MPDKFYYASAKVSGLFGSDNGDLKQAEKTNSAFLSGSISFRVKFAKVLQDAVESVSGFDPNTEEYENAVVKAKAVAIRRNYGEEKPKDSGKFSLTTDSLATLNSDDLSIIFMTLRDVGAFGTMLEMRSVSDNPEFLNARHVLEAAAAARTHTTPFVKADPNAAIELCNQLDAQEVNQTIPFSGEAQRARARANYMLYHAADKFLKVLPELETLRDEKKKLEAGMPAEGDLAMFKRLHEINTRLIGKEGEEGLLAKEERFNSLFPRYVPANGPQSLEHHIRDYSAYVRGEATTKLDASRAAYQEGFDKNLEVASGIGLMHRQLSRKMFGEAKNTGEITYWASIRDGGLQSKDPWCLINMAEAACFAGRDITEINSAINRLHELQPPKWMLRNTLSGLKKVSERLEAMSGDTPDAIAIREKLDVVIGGFESIRQNKAPNLPGMPIDEATKVFYDSTYSYRGMLGSTYAFSHEVGQGNIKFGGQTLGQTVSREDARQFAELRKVPLKLLLDEKNIKDLPEEVQAAMRKNDKFCLDDIKDIKVLAMTTPVLVRQTFRNTDEDKTVTVEPSGLDLENMHGEGHKKFDDAMRGLIRLSGVDNFKKMLEESSLEQRLGGVKLESLAGKDPLNLTEKDKNEIWQEIKNKIKEIDASTNISVMVALGLGDCRQHGQMNQLLCDGWQRDKTDMELRNLQGALKDGNRTKADDSIERIKEINRFQIRTADIAANLNILTEKDEKYSPPVRTADGKLIVDKNRTTPWEDHTMTVLAERESVTGPLKKAGDGSGLPVVGAADSFYRNKVYKWGDLHEMKVKVSGGKMVIDGGRTIEEAVEADFTRDSSGKVDPASIKNIRPVTGGIPVGITPLGYAGAKTSRHKPAQGGYMCLSGARVNGEFSLVEHMLPEARAKREEKHLELGALSNSGRAVDLQEYRERRAALASPSPSGLSEAEGKVVPLRQAAAGITGNVF